MSRITTHVLDTALGRPAAGIPVTLMDAASAVLAEGVTDADGRVRDLGPEELAAGDYRLVFETRGEFFPRVTLEFTLDAGTSHYHVPLLLSPFAFSTYRGS